MPPCRICDHATVPAGAKWSSFSQRDFTLRTCTECGYSFVADPREDYEALYDAAYYAGRGADPDINYNLFIADPRCSQRFEWQGVVEIVSSLTHVDSSSRWLDFGCGLGGLVRYGQSQGLNIQGH